MINYSLVVNFITKIKVIGISKSLKKINQGYFNFLWFDLKLISMDNLKKSLVDTQSNTNKDKSFQK
tara:strand:+ start:627 stop:824 length:198 start_codon:yes stop_codon:yes gene_type:complete